MNEVQKGLLPVVGIPCFLLVYLFYKYGKRSLNPDQTFSERMDYFYSFVSAALFGEFVFQALPNSTNAAINARAPLNSSVTSAFVFFGFFIMYCYQRFGRIWHDNNYYVSPETGSMEIRYALNPQTMELAEYFEAEEDSAEKRMILTDECVAVRLRRHLALLTLFILTVLSVLEGFFLVYQNGNKWAVLVVFFADKLVETGIVCVVMLHGFFHATFQKQWNWFLIGGFWWALVCTLSCLPVLLNMTQKQAAYVVTHMATNVFYAMGGGIVFWITWYYLCIDQKRTDGRETLVRTGLFGLTGAISWVIGYFY